jgi:hypothetical protein
LRGNYRIFWARSQAWLLGDLHIGNIMLDTSGTPTIIDALIGEIPARLLASNGELAETVKQAKANADLRDGERRSKPTFSPAAPEQKPAPNRHSLPDYAARRKRIFGDRVFSDAEVQEMRDFETGDS